MSNPLLAINDALEIVKDAFQVVRNCSVDEIHIGVTGTSFDPPDLDFASVQIAMADEEVENLMVVAMMAAFELRLKQHLRNQFNIKPTSQTGKIAKWLDNQIENVPLDRIKSVFKSVAVQDRTWNEIKNIQTYRNWVAHGRNPNKKPTSAVTPSLAYNVLTDFMVSAGLI